MSEEVGRFAPLVISEDRAEAMHEAVLSFDWDNFGLDDVQSAPSQEWAAALTRHVLRAGGLFDVPETQEQQERVDVLPAHRRRQP